MTLKAVFIDAGNTLLYEKPSRFEIYAEVARRHGVALTTPEMNGLMRRAHRALPVEIDGAYRYSDRWFAAYIDLIFHEELGIAKREITALRDELFARFARPETFALFPGALELLSDLRLRKFRLGVISNWSARLPGLLDALGIGSAIDFVLCSAIERAEKPDPELFERALSRAGVAPEEALHAGDDLEKDLLGAQRAGLRSVLVDHAKLHADAPAGVERVTDLYELGASIAAISG